MKAHYTSQVVLSVALLAVAGWAHAETGRAADAQPKALKQPGPSAAAHQDAKASEAYSAHRMQDRGSKMAVCRKSVEDKGLAGTEARQELLNCMR